MERKRKKKIWPNISGLTVSQRLKATDLAGSSERVTQWKLHILCRSSPAVPTFILVHTVCLLAGPGLTPCFFLLKYMKMYYIYSDPWHVESDLSGFEGVRNRAMDMTSSGLK